MIFNQRLALRFIATLCLSAGGLQAEGESFTPFRENVRECQAVIAVRGAQGVLNDSVALRLSDHSPQAFRESLEAFVKSRGSGAVKGARIFFTGVPMGVSERTFLAPFREVLRDVGFAEKDVSLRVISIPTKTFQNGVREALGALLERTIYWFPSLRRHYQRPEIGEVVSGILSTLPIEIPNAIYLSQTLPNQDLILTLTAHSAVLAAYSVYKKWLVNWLLDPGVPLWQSFVKQSSLSIPFIINYNIFGNWTKIQDYLSAHGVQASLQAFPAELASFVSTQSLTIVLQTLFQQIVITRGVRVWENSQSGDENSRYARTLSNIIAAPLLMIDAWALAVASGSGGSTLLEMGSMSVNTGHVYLGLLTLVGSSLAFYPRALLDWTLRPYRWALRILPRRSGSRHD